MEYINTFTTDGIYEIAITSKDVNGCENNEAYTVFVKVASQEIVHSIASSSHTPIFEVDSITGDSLAYYNLCIGEELTLVANATFPENNTSYTQSLATTEFTWYIDGVAVFYGLEYINTITTGGTYEISITSTDVNGCENTEAFNVFVRIFSIEHFISSSTHTPTFDTDSLTGDTIIYYDLCIGEELTLVAGATFPNINNSNTQTIDSTQFTWYLDNVEISTELEYTNTYTTSGGFIINITSENVNGCANTIPYTVYVRVSTLPTINLSANPPLICPDVESLISNDPAADVNINIVYTPGNWTTTPCDDEFSEPLYLPDGSGATYNTDITLACFGDGQTLTDVNDILSINVNMEHSYTGDLDIFITAPNGVQVQLFAQSGLGTWFGEATDNNATATNPGIGYDYGWSANPTYSGTMADGMANGNTTPTTAPNGATGITLNPDIYLPLNSLNALLGTPLNGDWTLTIVDNLSLDNGWIFSWGMAINQNIIPNSWSYNNFIVDQYWDANPTIVSSSGTDLTVFSSTPGIETYTYIIEDNFGCTYTEDMELTVTSHVTATSSTIDAICTTNTGEVSLSINGGTPNYNVYCNGGVFTGQNITNMAPGIYTYLIKDTIGCEFTGLDTIGIELIDLEFSYEETDDICDDEVGEITIVPTNGYAPYSYNWTINNPNSPTIANIGSGTYLAEVTDNYGCRGIAGTSIENVELELLFSSSSEYDHCEQNIGSVTVIPLNGLAPYIYNWSDGFPDTTTVPDLNNGEYDVLVTDSHGCVGETTIEVINIPGPTALFDVSSDTVVFKEALVDFINLSSSDPTTTIVETYWSFGEGTFTYAYQPSHNFHQVGSYIVELTVLDSEDCTDRYYKEIISTVDFLFWPPTAFSPNGDNINDEFKPLLKGIIEDSYHMSIYNRWGKLVFETRDTDEGWNGSLDDGSEVAQDSYTFMLSFNTHENVIQKKTGTFVLLR